MKVEDVRERIYRFFYKNLWNIPRMNEEKPKEVDMSPVGLWKTLGISTGYAQKPSPDTG
jgi:hypothetical protein